MITFNRNTLRDKIHACWIGKNIGGTMGAPYEGWRSKESLNIQGFSTPEGTVLPNDDLDLQLVWLRAMENVGPHALTPNVLGEYWMDYIPPNWNEYGIGKANMRAGLIPPLSGEYHNDWKHSNGAWIRTEIWACMAPGCPDVATRYSYADACVDHGAGEGTFAAIFVAAVESSAFVVSDIEELLNIGLTKIPESCRVARSIRLLLDCYKNGVDWWTCRQKLVEDSKDLGWFQAPCNVAFSMLGLLYGEGDFKKSMILAINCGDDTDCTGATLGSLWGIIHGTAGIPEDWKNHIGENITTIAVNRGALYMLPSTCEELTDRVMALQQPVLDANFANWIKISDDAADSADAEDIKGLYAKEAALELCAKKGTAYTIDLTWGTAEVLFDGDPVIEPNGNIKISIEFFNRFPEPKHLRFRWLLPEGFSVIGGSRDFYLPHASTQTKPRATCSFTIHAGDKLEALNRPVLEVSCLSRPTVGYVPITLLG